MKKYIYISIIIYLIGFISAVISKNNFILTFENNLSFNYNDLVLKNQNELFIIIIKNNTLMYLVSVFGFLTFGVLTLITTFYNGFVFGYLIIKLCEYSNGHNYILYNVMPHTIEIIGLVFSSAIGLYLSKYLYQFIFLNKFNQPNYKSLFVTTLIGYLFILSSAILEAYVSTK
jgi:uncharacterized membrane protein SpoIIM required for sporulation